MNGALLLALLLTTDPLGKQAVKTQNKNDVQAQITDQAGVTLLNVQGNNTTPGAGGGTESLIGNVESSAPSYTNGNIAMPWLDLGGRQYITTDAATNLRMNVTQVLGAALSATNPVFNQLSDGAAVYTAAKTGQFPAALGQTTMAGSNSVAIASNQTAIPTTVGAPTGAATNRATAVSIAASASSTITCKGSLATTTPVKLYRAHITSAGQVRCTLQYDSNASLTTFGDVMTSPGNNTQTFDCAAGFCAVTSGASGTQAIEALCTNTDIQTLDVVCDVQYCVAASGC